jgi:hypothetical protein
MFAHKDFNTPIGIHTFVQLFINENDNTRSSTNFNNVYYIRPYRTKTSEFHTNVIRIAYEMPLCYR